MGNRRLIIYYLGNLLMMSVKTGNLTGAYKYASDFVKLDLVGDDLKRDFEDLANQFKLRLEERLNIPLELVEETDVLVHRVMTGG